MALGHSDLWNLLYKKKKKKLSNQRWTTAFAKIFTSLINKSFCNFCILSFLLFRFVQNNTFWPSFLDISFFIYHFIYSVSSNRFYLIRFLLSSSNDRCSWLLLSTLTSIFFSIIRTLGMRLLEYLLLSLFKSVLFIIRFSFLFCYSLLRIFDLSLSLPGCFFRYFDIHLQSPSK